MTIDEFSTQEQLEQWGVQNFWRLIDSVPESEPFSELMTAFIGLRSIKKASRRWDSEQAPFRIYLRMTMEYDFAKFAREGRLHSAAEDALKVIEAGAR